MSVIVRQELPVWWIGKDGSDIVMPKFRPEVKLWTPTGKQVEEMIYNFMHNDRYVDCQVRQFFGTTKPKHVMQKWNNDIKLYTGTDPAVCPLFVKSRSAPSWKRFHDYVATDGVPTFHTDFDLKAPTRPGQVQYFSAASNRGTCRSCVAFKFDLNLSLIPSVNQLSWKQAWLCQHRLQRTWQSLRMIY
jgi:hypothetical protein